MEFITDITACIKELKETDSREEIKLANGLQTYVNDFINHSTLSNVIVKSDEEILIDKGPRVEEGEIFEEEGEITVKDEVLSIADVNKQNTHCFKVTEIQQSGTKHKRSVVLNCRFCPFLLIKIIECRNKNIVEDLRQHMRDEHGLCEICEINFDDRSDLFEHCESHKKEDGPFVCYYNGCTYTNKNLSGLFFHAQNVHHGVKYFKCEECKKPFTFLQSFVLHKNCHKRGKHNNCPMCKLSYTSWPRLRTHIREQHNNTCDSCKTVYSHVGNLITHLTKDKNVCQKRKKRNQD